MIYHAIKLNIFRFKNLLNTQLLVTHLMKEGKLVYCVKIIIISGKLI